MASSENFLKFILEQLSGLNDISYRAMMGEFILYYRGIIVGGIYDDFNQKGINCPKSVRLHRCIGQTPQDFNKNLKHGTVSFEEMIAIAETFDVGYEQAFIFPNRGKIRPCLENKSCTN